MHAGDESIPVVASNFWKRKMQESPRNDERAESFVQLLCEHQVRIFNCIMALLPRQGDAEEVYQECSTVLWRRFDQFTPGTDFAKWACHVAYLTALNYRRKQRHEPQYFSTDFLELVAAEQAAKADILDARRAALKHCLEKLTTRERELLSRRYQQKTTIRSLASEAGCTAKSYYRLLDRVRQRLLECIGRTVRTEARGTE
jgi:RNA polymerase sigma-70 factor (ECF subfamily)